MTCWECPMCALESPLVFDCSWQEPKHTCPRECERPGTPCLCCSCPYFCSSCSGLCWASRSGEKCIALCRLYVALSAFETDLTPKHSFSPFRWLISTLAVRFLRSVLNADLKIKSVGLFSVHGVSIQFHPHHTLVSHTVDTWFQNLFSCWPLPRKEERKKRCSIYYVPHQILWRFWLFYSKLKSDCYIALTVDLSVTGNWQDMDFQ